MHIALQMFTLRDYMNTLDKIPETLKKVKEMGYEAVQISGIGPFIKEKVDLIKKVCDDLQLTICATHTGLPNLLNEFEWFVEYHKLWNCKYVGVGMMPSEFYESEAKLIEFAKIMNEIGEKLSRAGLILIYHNHAVEFRKYNGKLGMEILFEKFNQYVHFEIDTFWVQKGGCNPVDWINKVNGRMDVVHFKDMGLTDWEHQTMESVGNGNLNWDAIISACQTNKVTWACVEQDDTNDINPFKCAESSLKYLKTKGFKLIRPIQKATLWLFSLFKG